MATPLRQLRQLGGRKRKPLSRSLEETEFFRPTPELRARDVVREVPSAVETVGKAVRGFLWDIPKYVARAALSIGLSTPLGRGFEEKEGRKIKTVDLGIDKIFEEDIESLGARQKRVERELGEKGIEVGAKPLSFFGVGAITTLDLLFGSGKKTKGAIDLIADTAERSKILNQLKAFKISDDIAEEAANALIRTKDRKVITNVIKTSEILTKVEKKTGVKPPANLKPAVSEALDDIFTYPKSEVNLLTKKLTDDIVRAAPTAKKVELAAKDAIEVADDLRRDAVMNIVSKNNEKFINLVGEGKMSFDEYGQIRSVLDDIEGLRDAKNQIEEVIPTLKRFGFDVADEMGVVNPIEKEKKLIYEKALAEAKEALSLEDFKNKLPERSKKIIGEQNIDRVFIAGKNASKQTEFAGAFLGFERDDNGQIKFNPTMALAGFLGVKSAKNVKNLQNIKKAVKIEEKIAQASTKYSDILNKKRAFNLFRKKENKIVSSTKAEQVKDVIKTWLEPISTSLEKINPELKKVMRRFEVDAMEKSYKRTTEILPFLKAQKKMSKQDAKLFDMARKNADGDLIAALSDKYGISDELNQTRKILDGIFEDASRVGIEINYTKNYHPRMVKDPKKFLEFLHKDKSWGEIQSLLEERALTKGKKYSDLADEEKISIINNFIRGYGNKVSLSKPGPAKERRIIEIGAEIDDFYLDSNAALVEYVNKMTDQIAARRFFGKALSIDTTKVNVDDSVGAYVMRLLADGKIRPQDEQAVADILRARFNRRKMNGAIETVRNMEYISTMGSPVSAVTQIGDIAWAGYDSGHFRALLNATKALIGKSKIKKSDLGIDRIAQEFAGTSRSAKALDFVFKAVGLDKVDSLGKEALINGHFSKLSRLSKKNPGKAREIIGKAVFEDEIEQTLKEFANGEITERTKFAVFNRLLDFQPIAKSEMPRQYLEMSNGRIFYMLKSFTIKQFDAFRRESFRDISNGLKKNSPKLVTKGIRNLVLLGGAFMLYNATADEIKDMLLGRETSLQDRTIDNALRLLGATKYDIYKARTEGLATTTVKKILPPTSVVDRGLKDVENIITSKAYKTGELKGQEHKLESVQTVPVAGKFYYWWFGRGAQKEKYSSPQKTTKSNSGKDLLRSSNKKPATAGSKKLLRAK